MIRGKCIVLGAVILMAGAAPAGAFTFLDRTYGSPELGNSARSRAMGGAGAALGNGAWSVVDNPGALFLARGTRVQVLGFGAQASENRFVPLFDTFDSFVDETAIAVNQNGYGSLQGGFVLDAWGKTGPIISGGYFNRFDARYDYVDEQRRSTISGVPIEQRDKILNHRVIETEGGLHSASVAVTMPVTEILGVGAGVNYYFGTITERNGLVVTPAGEQLTSDTTLVTTTRRKFDGYSFTFGWAATLGRVDVGGSVETSPHLDDDFTTWENDRVTSPARSNGNVTLPMRLQYGMAYRPRNAYRTTFAADVVYMPWTSATDDFEAEPVNDVWEARFGLEHVFYNNLPARLGFRYGESYAQQEADHSVFTFGFGYVLDHITLDLAGEVEKRNTRQDPIRPRAEQGPYVGLGKDRVEDTLFRAFLGASYNF